MGEDPGVPSELRTARKVRAETTGLERDPSVERHDPSNVIRHGGRYHFWFTEHPAATSGFREGYIRRATSEDGTHWTLHGTAYAGGRAGEWDEQTALTSYVVPQRGRFYMFYTGVPAEFEDHQTDRRGIGYVVANSVDGPWRKEANEPLLWPGEDGAWDELCCDDANLIYRERRWWLYYKGRRKGDDPNDSRIGVAFADELTGPYEEYPHNPVFIGHALTAWVHRQGVAAIGGGNQPDLLWSPDGLNFQPVVEFPNQSTGLYCPENFGNGVNTRGVEWGIDVDWSDPPRYLYRFNCNLRLVGT
ncbi:MAG: family 43 glycosylhydrolase [Candidatus Brocadiaceae bacterium]|jgi:hypothetical protein